MKSVSSVNAGEKNIVRTTNKQKKLPIPILDRRVKALFKLDRERKKPIGQKKEKIKIQT